MRRLIGAFLTAAMLMPAIPRNCFHSQTVLMPVPRIRGEFPYCYHTELLETGEPYVVYDEFLSSQAKGMTTTSYHRSPYLPEKLVLTGPEEESEYNSRSYYLRIYAREDTWAVEQLLYGKLHWRSEQTVTGHCFAEIYYIDEWIDPGL